MLPTELSSSFDSKNQKFCYIPDFEYLVKLSKQRTKLNNYDDDDNKLKKHNSNFKILKKLNSQFNKRKKKIFLIKPKTNIRTSLNKNESEDEKLMKAKIRILPPPGITSTVKRGTTKIATTTTRTTSEKTLKSLIKIYLSECTIHGVSYVANENVTGYKRKLWFIILCFALLGTIYSAISFKIRSDRSRLTNVLENISYPVYLITFPAITICNNNRINWLKMDDAIKEFLPHNSSNSTKDLFRKFATKLEDLTYGKFDCFSEFENSSLEDLDHITMEDLSVFLSHNREDIFETCWIINDYVSCNDTFGKQKTDHGNCYTYNSILTERGQRRALSESFFPTRYSTEGAGTGLKLRINLNPLTKRPGNEQEDGILVIIHVISEWPSRSFFAPTKSERQVILNPILYEADEEIKRLPPETRQCFFEDEIKHSKFITLPGHKYNFKNCISQCRQKYLLQYCGCSLGIFYPLGNYPDCRPSDMKCLSKYNRIFANFRNSEENYYVKSTGDGIICDCLESCYSIHYNYEVRAVKELTHSNDSNAIILDIYYRHSKIQQYKTFLVYNWLDWLVYYGGIAALFLGCSLISIAEIFYYFIIGFLLWIKEHKKQYVPSVNEQIYINNVNESNYMKNNEKNKF